MTRTDSVKDYVDLLVLHLNKSTEHSYMITVWSNYLKRLKETLPENKIIVLGEFVENYTFLVQDETQGMHWKIQQRSLHPVAIYYCEPSQTKSYSLRFISDDLMHDDFVYIVITETVAFNNNFILSNLSKVNYFSNGCSG